MKNAKTTSTQFSNQELNLDYWPANSKDYKPKPISEQLKILKKVFPKLNTKLNKTTINKILKNKTPKEVEGWFAIPRWNLLAKTYYAATIKVLCIIDEKYRNNFDNSTNKDYGNINKHQLIKNSKAFKALKIINKAQAGQDIIIIPGQLGANRCEDELKENEFYFGLFEIAILLLTHPERLQQFDDLPLICGDKYAEDGESFSQLLHFAVYQKKSSDNLMTEIGVFRSVEDMSEEAFDEHIKKISNISEEDEIIENKNLLTFSSIHDNVTEIILPATGFLI